MSTCTQCGHDKPDDNFKTCQKCREMYQRSNHKRRPGKPCQQPVEDGQEPGYGLKVAAGRRRAGDVQGEAVWEVR